MFIAKPFAGLIRPLGIVAGSQVKSALSMRITSTQLGNSEVEAVSGSVCVAVSSDRVLLRFEQTEGKRSSRGCIFRYTFTAPELSVKNAQAKFHEVHEVQSLISIISSYSLAPSSREVAVLRVPAQRFLVGRYQSCPGRTPVTRHFVAQRAGFRTQATPNLSTTLTNNSRLYGTLVAEKFVRQVT